MDKRTSDIARVRFPLVPQVVGICEKSLYIL